MLDILLFVVFYMRDNMIFRSGVKHTVGLSSPWGMFLGTDARIHAQKRVVLVLEDHTSYNNSWLHNMSIGTIAHAEAVAMP